MLRWKEKKILFRLLKKEPQKSIKLLIKYILSAELHSVIKILSNFLLQQFFLHSVQKYRTVKDFAESEQTELENLVKSTGFYKSKAHYIKGSSLKIISDFGGKVPQTMEDLITLPGVARKTANIVLSSAFGINDGIAVDTHVKRVSYRLGLTEHKNPVKIEQDLVKLIPKADWDKFSLLLIYHGRDTCSARKPKCSECPFKKICPKNGLVNSS